MMKKKKRQMLDEAVQDIHTDSEQVDDEMEELPSDEMRMKLLEELRRRGGKPYPERGPDGRGAGFMDGGLKEDAMYDMSNPYHDEMHDDLMEDYESEDSKKMKATRFSKLRQRLRRK